MFKLFKELSDVIAYFDDILIFECTLESHYHNLKRVLDRISKSGLTLNLKKSKIARTPVNFLGHVISSYGILAFDNLKNFNTSFK